MQVRLLKIFDLLLERFGPRHWWPAHSPFEMMVGAVLTQAVAWRNVEQAIANLEGAGLLSPQGIYQAESVEIERLIRPTRYYRMKTKKLQALVKFIVEQYQGDLDLMFQEDPVRLRAKLLQVYGLGPESVDAILLYAGKMMVFVIDEYTKRIFSRLGIVASKISYRQLQTFFTTNLPAEAPLYNEYHALIDRLGNQVCHLTPRCQECPLVMECEFYKASQIIAPDTRQACNGYWGSRRANR
jgi:endonuclease-3 related protein